MRRIAFYGGSFDPVHCGHLIIAREIAKFFSLDEFTFIPAHHAPHKRRRMPTSPFHRFAMLCLATEDEPRLKVSKMELDVPHRPYTFETLTTLNEKFANDQIFFVMGADSWMDITTWREWESVLKLSNHIVVTRPGFDLSFGHVTEQISERMIDTRQLDQFDPLPGPERRIYITDAVNLDVSSTEIRRRICDNEPGWQDDVPEKVAKYIEKYQIYT